MSNWADDALRKLRQKQADQQIRDAKFVEQQNVKRASGVPLWNEVRNSIRTRIFALKEKSGGNNVLAIQGDQLNEMVVRNEVDSGLLLHVTFSPDTGAIERSCGNEDKDGWEIAIADDGRARFHWGMVPTTPDSIAQQMLNALVGI